MRDTKVETVLSPCDEGPVVRRGLDLPHFVRRTTVIGLLTRPPPGPVTEGAETKVQVAETLLSPLKPFVGGGPVARSVDGWSVASVTGPVLLAPYVVHRSLARRHPGV